MHTQKKGKNGRNSRGRCKAAATSKMERFGIIVNRSR